MQAAPASATATHPEPFGIAAFSANLDEAKQFYTKMYPYEVVDGVFADIKYLSIMKDGEILVIAFERSDRNPMVGMIPMLKVDSVPDEIKRIESIGGKTVIPTALCPCTNANFAICEDAEGNQFMVKEGAPG